MAFGPWPSTFGSRHISFQNYSRSPKEGRRASRSEHNPARPTGARRVGGLLKFLFLIRPQVCPAGNAMPASLHTFTENAFQNRIHFFIQFRYRFLELFGLQNDLQNGAKIHKNAFQNSFHFLNRFFIDVGLQMHAPRPSKVCKTHETSLDFTEIAFFDLDRHFNQKQF